MLTPLVTSSTGAPEEVVWVVHTAAGVGAAVMPLAVGVVQSWAAVAAQQELAWAAEVCKPAAGP